MTTKAFKGTRLQWIQNVLSVSNQDDWFDILETITKGEDIKFLLTKTLTRYSTIKDLTKTEIPGNNQIIFFVLYNSKQPKNKQQQIISKYKEYIKAQSNFVINLQAKINKIN